MGFFTPNARGTANSGADGFIGVNVGEVKTYVEDICGVAIKSAVTAAKETKTVFNALEDGWTGVALENFEANFTKAVVELEKSLASAYKALVKEIVAVTDGMVEQDQNMVERL